MPLRALLYRRPTRATGDRARVRRRHVSRAAAPSSPRAALHAAHPGGDARGRAHHAAARQRQGGEGVRRASTAAGSRRGSGGCRRRCRSRTARSCRCAASRTASCIAAACAARCGARSTSAAIGCICVAGEAPHVARRVADFLKREARRDLEAASRRYADELGVDDQAHRGARPVEPLGLVLDHRRAVLLLAARFSRRPSCSTISPRTRSPISSR